MPFEIHNKMSKQKLSLEGKDSAEVVGAILVYFDSTYYTKKNSLISMSKLLTTKNFR